MSDSYLEVKNVDFTIGGKIKVKNASFAIENEGDTLCILGPSGIGKTTILRTCLLYTSPSPRDYAASRMPSSA